MLLEIKKYPDPVLRRKCQAVKEVTQDIKKLSRAISETMEKKDSAGLAAPQVGILKRIIAVETEKKAVVFINPKIIKKSKASGVMEEGCLSFPGVWLKIKRAKTVEVEALNIDGKKIQIKAEGVFSQVLQHEINHLDGILFIDRVSLFQRVKIRKKLNRV